jgi:hypothetical protein
LSAGRFIGFFGGGISTSPVSLILGRCKLKPSQLRIGSASVARYVDDFRPATRFSPDSSTIGLWHLDETGGSVAADSGPNNLPMQIRNGGTVLTSSSMCTSLNAATSASFLVANTNLRTDTRSSSIERVDIVNGITAAITSLFTASDSVIDQPRGLDVDVASRQFFVKQATGAIMRGAWDGSSYTQVAASDIFGVGLEVDESAARVLWSDGTGIQSGAFDGGAQTRVVSGGSPVGLLVDAPRDRVFWHDISTQRIFVARRDGSGQTLVTGGVLETHGLDIDIPRNELWFADGGTDAIKRVSADGGPAVTVITSPAPTDVILDVPNGFVYWTESAFGQSVGLFRARMDGTNIVTLTTDLGTSFGFERLPEL